MQPFRIFTALLFSSVFLQAAAPGDRDAKVRNDRTYVTGLDKWIYNDLDAGYREAKRTGKPLLVVFRCIPCTACAGFDERIVNRDKHVQQLMDLFVCVRVIQANTIDLDLFQFDYDLSFAAFFMNADKTIYGRFGSRSDLKDTEKDISLEGFRKALMAALEIHANGEKFKNQIAGKQPVPVKVKKPLDYPSLSGKYGPTIDYQGKTAQSCIHCHQVRDAERLEVRRLRQTIPDELLYPWPMPDVVGMKLDPSELATVTEVIADSPAEKSGLKKGDIIIEIENQRPISIADVQWVLHRQPSAGGINLKVERAGKTVPVKIALEEGWRRNSDISWRVGTWELRRMLTGGLLLSDLGLAERQRAGIAADELALKVDHAGEYGEHAAAKNAGIRKGDIVVQIGSQKKRATESQVFPTMISEQIGKRVPFTVLRDGKRVTMDVPMQ